jgi:hypothetical protein
MDRRRRSIDLPARTILVAAGTQPNTVLRARTPATSTRRQVLPASTRRHSRSSRSAISKPGQADVLLSRRADGRAISFFGDLHPSFFGNVVKAMGSAKQGYPIVSRVLAGAAPASAELRMRVLRALERRTARDGGAVERLTPTIVEVVCARRRRAQVPSPASSTACRTSRRARRASTARAARDGRPGADRRVGRPERGLVSTIVLEMGGSSDLCATLQPGEPVVLMGRPARRPRSSRRDRAAGRRRPRQRGAVLDRPGAARGRLEGAVLRRLQEA